MRLLSERFINHFYQHDWRWCLPYCDPDIEYFGSTNIGYAKGLDNFRELMVSSLSRYNPSLPISGSANVSVLPGGGATLVTMRFYLVTDPLGGEIAARRKRATLLWLSDDQGPRLRHIHLSLPAATALDDDEHSELTHRAVLYARSLVKHLAGLPSVTLRDVEGNIEHFSPAEVRYIEASGKTTIVHTLNRDIVVRESFSHVLAQMGDDILSVHRSFAINPSCVRTVRPDSVVLDDGTAVPLPQRRSHAVRTQIEQAMQATHLQLQSLTDWLQRLP